MASKIRGGSGAVPAVDHERTPPDNHVLMDDRDAIAELADWPRPKLAA